MNNPDDLDIAMVRYKPKKWLKGLSMWFSKKRKSIDELKQAFSEAFGKGEDAKAYEVIDELRAYNAEPNEITKLADITGWALLCAKDRPSANIGELFNWFMEKYPFSLSPVRVEFAANMAAQEKYDLATHIAHGYLHDVKRMGGLRMLDRVAIVRRGVGDAFLILTAAYTYPGARSYSLRVLEHASRLPLLPGILAQYQKEMANLHDELKDERNQKIDAVWERFYSGQGADVARKLMEWCDKNKYPLMAQRIELIDGQFRFDRNFRADENEIYAAVVRIGKDGPYMLRPAREDGK